jgi:hypothetical protein
VLGSRSSPNGNGGCARKGRGGPETVTCDGSGKSGPGASSKALEKVRAETAPPPVTAQTAPAAAAAPEADRSRRRRWSAPAGGRQGCRPEAGGTSRAQRRQ